MSVNPDGVFISNGPGNPLDIPLVIENIKEIIGKKQMTGICLGHQLIALALGGKKLQDLKFGHHGANHLLKILKNIEYLLHPKIMNM